MTDKLKNILENAPVKTRGNFRFLFFLSNGEYDGFWGKNGYDNILIFGYDVELEKWCKIAAYADKFDVFNVKGTFNLDIPHDLGIPVIYFDKPVYIDNSLMLSNVIGRIGQWEYENDDNGNDISGEDLDEQYQRGRATREFIEDLTRGDEKEEQEHESK